MSSSPALTRFWRSSISFWRELRSLLTAPRFFFPLPLTAPSSARRRCFSSSMRLSGESEFTPRCASVPKSPPRICPVKGSSYSLLNICRVAPSTPGAATFSHSAAFWLRDFWIAAWRSNR